MAPGMTMTGDIVGTLRYMSPEQALANRVTVDHRSDIYSFGVTLYELATLQPAFDADNRHELLRQIAFEEPRPPRRINRSVPQDLETIILKSISRNPSDRYFTAAEVAADLRAFLDDKPIAASRPGLRVRSTKWMRRHRGLVATTCGILLLAVTAIAVFAAREYMNYMRVRNSLQELLVSAQIDIAQGDFAKADGCLKSIQARALGCPRAADELQPAVEQALKEVEMQLRFQRFVRLADTARFSTNRLVTPGFYTDWESKRLRCTSAMNNCKAALAVYGFTDEDDLQKHIELLEIPEHAREQAGALAVETLANLARCEVERPGTPDEQQAALNRGVQLLERAQTVAPTFRAI